MSLDTYAVAGSVAVPAAATDIVALFGSATRQILISRVRISVTSTAVTAAMGSAQLFFRSTVNTGGTPASPTAVQMDSKDKTGATAAITTYGTPPTVGAGNPIRSARVLAPLLSSTVNPNLIVWDFDFSTNQCLLLHGTLESLCINLSGFGANTLILDYEIQWFESL